MRKVEILKKLTKFVMKYFGKNENTYQKQTVTVEPQIERFGGTNADRFHPPESL